jgi:hypothetical protein
MNKLLWVVLILLWIVWSTDYFYFRHQGARFTAADGQSLCLRVQTLEKDRLIVKPCEYTHDSR